MSILYKLYLTRMKANIRHVFSRKGSAIFAILMMLLYGGLIVMSLSKPEIALSMQNITDANMAIMIGVGFTALMVGVMLLQKKKGAVYGGGCLLSVQRPLYPCIDHALSHASEYCFRLSVRGSFPAYGHSAG